MIQVTIFPHSCIDVITNSSTELFCEISSKRYLPVIKAGLEELFGHEVFVNFSNEIYEDAETNPTYGEDSAIQFEIEYGDFSTLTNEFCSLLNFYLISLVGEGNFKINKDVCY